MPGWNLLLELAGLGAFQAEPVGQRHVERLDDGAALVADVVLVDARIDEAQRRHVQRERLLQLQRPLHLHVYQVRLRKIKTAQLVTDRLGDR